LSNQTRRDIVARVIRRIDVLESSKVQLRLRVFLHSGRSFDQMVLGATGRLRRIEALAAEGRSHRQIAAKLLEEGILNRNGKPFTANTVAQVLRKNRSTAKQTLQAKAEQELIRLWPQGLTRREIVRRLTEEGVVRPDGREWTAANVSSLAQRLKFPPLKEAARESLREPIQTLTEAGMSAATLAATLNVQGPKPLKAAAWTPDLVYNARQSLGIRSRDLLPSSRKGDLSKHPAEGASHEHERLVHRTDHGKPGDPAKPAHCRALPAGQSLHGQRWLRPVPPAGGVGPRAGADRREVIRPRHPAIDGRHVDVGPSWKTLRAHRRPTPENAPRLTASRRKPLLLNNFR
jgi:Recombinase